MERRFFLFHSLIILLLVLPLSHLSGQDTLHIVENIRAATTQGVTLCARDMEIERLNNQGKDYFGDGNFDAAETTFDSIFQLDPNSIKARNNLGVLYKKLGRYNDALRVYFEAESIVRREKGPTSEEIAKLYNNIGNVFNLKRDYELALQYLTFAENIFRDAGIRSSEANTVYTNIGNSYYGMQEWRKALRSYQEGIEAKLSTDKKGLDAAYANCATMYEQLNELDSASMYYNYSIDAKKDLYTSPDFRFIPTYNNYGGLLLEMGEREKAYEYLTMALDLAEDAYENKHPDVADSHRELATWYLEGGETGKALDHYQQGIISVVFDFNSTNIFDNPAMNNEIISEDGLLELLRDKAVALDKLYREKKESKALYTALETLELANNLAEKMRSSYLSEGSKLLITEYARTGYDRSIHTAYDLFQLSEDEDLANKAFKYAEKSKSSVLLASLQEVERKKNLAIPAGIQELEQELKQEKDVYKKKLYEESQRSEPDQYMVEKWEEKLFYLSQQLDSIDNEIRERFPEYAAKYDNEVIDLNGAMDRLSKDEVLIEYSLCDTSIYAFLVTPNGFNINRMLVDSAFHSHLNVLSQFLRDNDFASNTFEDYRAYTGAAWSLYTVLLKPLEAEIEGKKLLIIPDGQLGYIPFEALLTEMPAGGSMDYRSLPYLLYRNRTSYSYSATLYFTDETDREPPEKTLLAFAPTYDNIGDISSNKFPTYRDYSTYLVPLRFIATEIGNISEIIATDKYEAYDATEKAFKENAPDYNILHLAMHTLLNDENPMYSKLVFTMNNDTLEENDGLLNAYEIFNMQLNARMAVLSACNTGYGKLQKGEGVMSMARGFIFAGVPSIIMTLWAVEDQSGSVLMSMFYQKLVEGMEIDEALQEAKLQYLQNADQLGAHPYLWSGYVSIGSTDALVGSSFDRIFVISGGVVVFLVLIIIAVRRIKRNKQK